MLKKTPAIVNIIPRDAHFEFSSSGRKYWFGGHALKSMVMNATSILFPQGEKFFMDSVRHYRKDIHDPQLQEDVKAFLFQEALHTREHVRYNQGLDAQGYCAQELHLRTKDTLDKLKQTKTPLYQLAVTCGLEHYTAMLAGLVLKDERILESADEAFKNAWKWHAIEECEHKGVAYDVYLTVTEGKPLTRYLTRTGAMLRISYTFLSTISYNTYRLMKDDGIAHKPSAWLSFLNVVLGWEPGLFRRIGFALMSYFRPGFHPWEHDDSHLIKKALSELIEGTQGDDAVYDVKEAGKAPVPA